MKIRTGFVTNSSSTSFCIVGASFDRDEALEWVKKSLKVIAAVYKQRTGEDLNTEAIEEEFPYSLTDIVPDLAIYSDDYTCYMGLNIENMKDKDTLGDFKKRATDLLTSIGIKMSGKASIIAETIEG